MGIVCIPDAQPTIGQFRNEGGENSPLESIASRGWWVSLAYYASQGLLMLGYVRLQKLGVGASVVTILLVAALRALSSGVAILTVAMVMGREMVQRASSRA